MVACSGRSDESDETEVRADVPEATQQGTRIRPEAARKQKTGEGAPVDRDADEQPIPREPAARPPFRFAGRWATERKACPTTAWHFTETSLRTPAGSVCDFTHVAETGAGYDIDARCTAEGSQGRDVLRIRFAESAKAMMFESDIIADAGLVSCAPDER